MGNVLKLFKKNKEFRILMQGLDAAGKTTILYQLKLGEVVTTIPTIGFNVETIHSKNVNLTVWDVGMRSKSRVLYRHYYPNTQALVFVIDSNDRERISEAKYELHTALKEDDLRDTVVLVLANKQDLSEAMSLIEVTEALELHKVKHICNIFPTSATANEGLQEAFDWLADAISSNDPKEFMPSNLNSNEKIIRSSGYLQKSWEAVKKLFVY